jgi:hypothetical protein
MAQATKILVERLEAAQRNAALATDRKVAQLGEQIEALRAATAAPLVSPTTPVSSPTSAPAAASEQSVPGPAGRDAPNDRTPAPAMSGSFGHITGQLPHLDDHALAEISRPLFEHGPVHGSESPISDTARLRQVTAPPMPPLVPTSMSPAMPAAPAVHTAHEDVDIARLTSLISEKLDHLSLPKHPE